MEVIETIAWGLRELGHQTSYALNRIDPSATNIIFGAQMLPVDYMKQLPGNSIVYDLEQLRNLTVAEIKPQMHYAAQRFEIWEYSSANLQAWQDMGATRVKAVPIGYAPVITRIAKAPAQDIDVLLYGISGVKRLQAVHDLSQAGLTTLFVSGLYGKARDDLIARSKIVLNVNLYDYAQIFEIVRVSYLLANRKAVVATKDAATVADADIESAVKFTTAEQLMSDCLHLVEHDDVRAAMETQGFEIMSQRDIRDILRAAIA
jgi:hypothetical protein